jgi:hypothetical protein
MGRRPAELISSPGGGCGLIEQEDFGEVVAQACPGLVIGARHGPGGAGSESGRLGQLGDCRIQSVADDVAAMGGEPRDSSTAVAVATLETMTIPRMPGVSSTRRSIGSFHATRAGGFNGDSSLIEELSPKIHRPLMWM